MGLHSIGFLTESATAYDPNTPPHTLPVMYKDDRLAIAVCQNSYYTYNLPPAISEILDSGTFVQQFAYRDEFNQIHAEYAEGRVLGAIYLVFVE